MNFRVDLESYRGPLDLLLYLVRKHEVPVSQIPVGVITEQYLAYLEVLEQLDVNAVGDFLELASTLMEIKSRMILPRADEETEEIDDPREELVQRLLDYKKFKDAASLLEEQGRDWQQRYARVANDVPARPQDLSHQPIKEVELWDLVSSFGRIMRDTQSSRPSSIVYDETPIHVYMSRIHERLGRQERVAFSEMFDAGMHKSAMIGVFLAILELVRHHRVETRQVDGQGEIWILPGKNAAEMLDVSEVDNYDTSGAEPDPPEPPPQPR